MCAAFSTPLSEVLLVVICATIANCDDYDHIATRGKAYPDFLRHHAPFEHGVPGGRWLTILMNRISPALFSTALAAWVCETCPERREMVAIDGKISRRSQNRAAEEAALHLLSTFTKISRLVLGLEAVSDKANELTATPTRLARLVAHGGLQEALVRVGQDAAEALYAGPGRRINLLTCLQRP